MFWRSFKKSLTKNFCITGKKNPSQPLPYIFFWIEHIYLIITVRTKAEDGVFYVVQALAHPYSQSVSLYIHANKRIKATYAGKKQKIRIAATEAW